MKKNLKAFFILLSVVILLVCFSSCGKAEQAFVINIEKTLSTGSVETYTITYSDGSISQIEIKNGKDGEDLSVNELFEKYLDLYPDATYEDFLNEYLTFSQSNTTAINKALQSSAKVYAEFTQAYRINPMYVTVETAVYMGSAVVYKKSEDYTYFITNYHVVYLNSAYESNKIAKRIVCYLYGSEDEPYATNEKDENGCTVYNYGDYAVECEYVGGSVTADIAVIKAKTADVDKINDGAEEIAFADGYHVGDTAIAIGNPEGEGISVTEGIVSVDNEMITLSLDGTAREYRSIRMDTSIYSGSSGGGLFNTSGELIGITNAGATDVENVNYAIPVEIVKAAVENITYYAAKGETQAKKITLNFTLESKNSKYVYDKDTGYGKITESIYIKSVNCSICNQMGLSVGDRILAFYVNQTEHIIDRQFEIGDVLLTIRSGDKIYMQIERDGEKFNTFVYTVKDSDLSQVA